MEQMYQDYKDIAEFRIVYIREAHAADSDWSVLYAKTKGINNHKDYGERCAVADSLVKDKKLTIPFIIDKMDNKTNEAYSAWPDRVFVVRSDGRLAVAGNRGPWGFAPAIEEAEEWLAAFKKTGAEPKLAESDEKTDGGSAGDEAGAGG